MQHGSTDFKASFKQHMLKTHLKLEQPHLVDLFIKVCKTKLKEQAFSAVEQGRDALWHHPYPTVIMKALKSMLKEAKEKH